MMRRWESCANDLSSTDKSLRDSHKLRRSESTLYPPTSSSSGTSISRECLTYEGTSSSSSGHSSDDSYVYNKWGNIGVHVFYSEKDERLVDDNIVKRLERRKIEYYFSRRDSLPGRSRKQLIKDAVRVHPVTLLAITENFNSEFPDKELRDLIVYKRKMDFDRFVCVKLTKSAAIPTLFSDLVCVDLTKNLKECENEVDKMIRVSEMQIKRFLKKQKKGKENDVTSKEDHAKKYLKDVDDEIQHRKELYGGDDKLSFLCVRRLVEQASGLHIRKDLLDDIGKEYRELGLDKHFDQSQGIQYVQDLFSRLHDESHQDSQRVTTVEHYLISNVIPMAESNGDIFSLSKMSTMFTKKFQLIVLRTLHSYISLNVPRLEDAITSEEVLRSSINIKSMYSSMRVLAYCDVLCNIVLAYCTSGTSIGGGLDVDVTTVEKCLPGIQVYKSVAEELAYDYSKHIMRNAKEFIGKIKKRKLDSVFPFNRHGISKFSEVVRSIQATSKVEYENVSEVVACLSRKLNKFSKFEQLLAFKYIAHLINSSDNSSLLRIFQRLLHRMKEETSQVFVFHVSQLMLQLIQSSVDEVRIETAKRLMLNGKGLLAVDSAQESDKNHIIEIFTQNGFAMGPPSIPKVHTPNPTYSTWSGTLNYKHVKLLVQTPKSLEDIANDANTSTKRKTVFNQEVQFLRQTTNHSNIVDLLGYQCQPSPCLIITEEWKETVSEYLLKQSRAGILRDVKELIELFLLPMLSAVIFCHKRNIILRDIVANNFFVQNPLKKHMVKYFNFRLAKRQRRESTQPDESAIYEDIMSDEIKGAPDDQIPMRYSAPESLMKNAYSTGSDSWMCTCLSYEVLTHGCQPYTELYGIRTEDVIQLVIQGYRIKQPPCIPDIVFMPMMGGVIHEPARRTTVNDLYDSLQEFSDRISALSATTEQKPLMIACQPPMRDTEQQSEPCRGIPENLQKPNTSSDETSLYDRTHNVTYWLNWEEILGPDEPSITTDKRFFHERVLSDRNPDDNEEIKLLTKHSNICQVVNLFQDKEGILCQEYVNHGGEGLLLLCIEKHCGVDELLGYLRDTAVALAYIHGQGWIHACLKARYIMVREGAAKVSRLGRAFRPEVLLYDKGSGDAIRTQEMPQDLLRWAPPEVIFYGMFSQKGDVFMFAQVCWEAFNALAFDSNSAEECFLPYPNKSAEQVKESLTKRNHQFQPTSCPDWLYQLMKYMWLCERSLRPPFDMIIRCFDAKSLQPLKQELETQPTHLLGKGSHYHSQIRKRLQYDDEQQNNYFERGTKRQQIAHGFQYGDVSRIVHSTKYTDVQSGKVYCRPIDMEPPVKIDETFSPSARRGNKKRSMRNVLPNVFRLRSSRSKSAKEEHQNSKQEFPHDSGVESSTSLSVKVKHRSMIGPSPSSYPLRSSEISSPKKPPTERLPEIPFKPPSSTDAMDYIYEVPEISEVRPPEKPKIPPKPKNLKQKVPPRAKVKEIPREMQTDRDHNDYECLNFTADPTSYTALMKGDTHGVSHTENGESKSSTVQQPEIDVEADGNQRVPLCLHSSEQEDTESTLTLENPEESSAFDSECESSYANAGQTSSDQGDETC